MRMQIEKIRDIRRGCWAATLIIDDKFMQATWVREEDEDEKIDILLAWAKKKIKEEFNGSNTV